jgi:hypothetical protein
MPIMAQQPSPGAAQRGLIRSTGLLPLRWGINRLAQCKTFPSPERCSERWSVLSAGLTNGVARCQKTGYPDPRQHFCTQRPGSAASLAPGHSVGVVEEGVTATSFRSSGRWEVDALRQSTAI